MSKLKIGITGFGSISALGGSREEIEAAYDTPRSFISYDPDLEKCLARLSPQAESALLTMGREISKFHKLDRSVQMAIFAALNARKDAGWQEKIRLGVSIGSARGASRLTEQYLGQFLASGIPLSPSCSPTTTLGNLSSNVANALAVDGFAVELSATCSTALHAFLNGVAWLESGRLDAFLVGGTEAPLTPFTFAQMSALHLYSKLDAPFPCRAGDPSKRENSLVLGEGAACFCLEAASEKSKAVVEGVGYAKEVPPSLTGMSKDGVALKQSMRMALAEAGLDAVDLVITHTPGTVEGDLAELKSLESVFSHPPILINNKWKMGHCFGASGALSLELAMLILERQSLPPQAPWLESGRSKAIRTVMVNSAGFGGQAMSLVLSSKLP